MPADAGADAKLSLSTATTADSTSLPPAGTLRTGPPLEAEALRRRVEAVDWWHTIDLGQGIVTPGRGGSGWRLANMGLPADLTGRTVLDIGTWDGLFAFEAERRGASRVLAIDDWQHPGFGVAHEALGSRVEFLRMDARDLSAEAPGVFDLVIFMGVLYHVPDPVAALARVAEVTGGQLILETDTALHHLAQPASELRVRSHYEDTAQNWWIPNPAAVERMLTATGFRRSEIVAAPRPPARGRMGKLARRLRLSRETETTRLIAHAWK